MQIKRRSSPSCQVHASTRPICAHKRLPWHLSIKGTLELQRVFVLLGAEMLAEETEPLRICASNCTLRLLIRSQHSPQQCSSADSKRMCRQPVGIWERTKYGGHNRGHISFHVSCPAMTTSAGTSSHSGYFHESCFSQNSSTARAISCFSSQAFLSQSLDICRPRLSLLTMRAPHIGAVLLALVSFHVFVSVRMLPKSPTYRICLRAALFNSSE